MSPPPLPAPIEALRRRLTTLEVGRAQLVRELFTTAARIIAEKRRGAEADPARLGRLAEDRHELFTRIQILDHKITSALCEPESTDSPIAL